MTHVVLESCIRCKYTDCVDVCPVDCFREGPNFLTIDPDECIDCAVCIPECPVNAIENIALIRNTKLAATAPATWDDAVAAGKKAGTKYPILLHLGATGDPYHMYPLQTSFGAPVFKQNADGSYTSELTLGGEGGEKFATWLAAQGKAGTLSTSITYDIAVDAFAKGKSPFLIGGPWTLDKFKDLDLAIDPIPSAGGEKAVPFVGVQGFFISAQSKNSIVANDFLTNYIATTDVQYAMYQAGLRTPALKSAILRPL